MLRKFNDKEWDPMNKQTKAWETPQLIILARGMPEENVLLSCKTMNPNQAVSGEAISQQDTCAAGADTANCSNCKSRGVADS